MPVSQRTTLTSPADAAAAAATSDDQEQQPRAPVHVPAHHSGHVDSPLLALLNHLPEVVQVHVLPRLHTSDLAMMGRVCSVSRAVVKACGLPRAGVSRREPLCRIFFMCSVERLVWARAHGCPWRAGQGFARAVRLPT